jgi:hypothetical protein
VCVELEVVYISFCQNRIVIIVLILLFNLAGVILVVLGFAFSSLFGVTV